MASTRRDIGLLETISRFAIPYFSVGLAVRVPVEGNLGATVTVPGQDIKINYAIPNHRAMIHSIKRSANRRLTLPYRRPNCGGYSYDSKPTTWQSLCYG